VDARRAAAVGQAPDKRFADDIRRLLDEGDLLDGLLAVRPALLPQEMRDQLGAAVEAHGEPGKDLGEVQDGGQDDDAHLAVTQRKDALTMKKRKAMISLGSIGRRTPGRRRRTGGIWIGTSTGLTSAVP